MGNGRNGESYLKKDERLNYYLSLFVTLFIFWKNIFFIDLSFLIRNAQNGLKNVARSLRRQDALLTFFHLLSNLEYGIS